MKDLILFDLDDTLIRGQSQKMLLNYLKEKKVITGYFYVRLLLAFVMYKLGLMRDPQKVMVYAYAFMKGMKVSEVETLLAPYIQTVLHECLNTVVVDKLKVHLMDGSEVVLVTNSADVLAKPLARALGITNVLATELEVKDEVFTGVILGKPVHGDEKVARVSAYAEKRGLILSNATFYSDHISDMPLFSAVRTRIVVNPKWFFEQKTKMLGWTILKS